MTKTNTVQFTIEMVTLVTNLVLWLYTVSLGSNLNDQSLVLLTIEESP